MKSLIFSILGLIAVLAGAVLLSIAFGGPKEPPPMASINDPFKGVDFSDIPQANQYTARDGVALAFRSYAPSGGRSKGSVVLVHGSSSRGRSMHVMAKAFAAAGYTAYALDIRGHGESGTKGYIDYVGQLEDDLEDFCQSVKPVQPSTLAGFSSGGGFALRFAGSKRQKLFSNYLFLSPFISQDAPTYRSNSGGWVSVGLPRYIAVVLLNNLGIRTFNHLPVIKYALNEEAKAFLTKEYAFALAQNFRPERDYRANIRAIGQPFYVVAGQDDEVFYSDHFAAVFKSEGKDVSVNLVPGVGHIQLTLKPIALQAAIAAVRNMNGQ